MTAQRENNVPAQGPAKSGGRVLVGVAGWAYTDWAGIVYPSPTPKNFHAATYLARFFDTIEINTSFYQPIAAEMARQWMERVQGNPRFFFTAKLWRKFTHEEGATAEDEKAARAGLDVLMQNGKLGALLLQFPFSFHYTAETRRKMEGLLRDFRDYPRVVEVRHRSWNEPDFYLWLQDQGVGFCNVDQPVIGRSLRPSAVATAALGYVRLHGRRYDTWFSEDPEIPPRERYNYLYAQGELQPWAERVKDIAEQAATTFVIANNHYQGKAAVNALELMHMLSGKNVAVPETLRHAYPRLEAIASEPSEQPGLFP